MKGLFAQERVTLRAIEPEDLPHFIRWENNSDLWSFGAQIQPLSKFVISEYLEQTLTNDIFSMRQVRFVIEYEKTIVGCIDFFDFDPLSRKASIGLVIDYDHQRNGFALEAVHKMLHYGFGMLNLHQIYAHVPVSNTPSVSLFEKSGFEKTVCLKDWICRKGKFEDVYLFQCIEK
ncbi:MAG: GNAT family N-acetyltransferase [Bacteroidales bacterium]